LEIVDKNNASIQHKTSIKQLFNQLVAPFTTDPYIASNVKQQCVHQRYLGREPNKYQ